MNSQCSDSIPPFQHLLSKQPKTRSSLSAEEQMKRAQSSSQKVKLSVTAYMLCTDVKTSTGPMQRYSGQKGGRTNRFVQGKLFSILLSMYAQVLTHHRWGYLPFNGGPRVCLGQQFALTEIAYTTVRLLQEFQGVESRDDSPWQENWMTSCSVKTGCQVALIPHEHGL
jgi:Cytochrome P450